MRKIILTLVALVAIASSAQDFMRIERKPCILFPENARSQTRMLPTPKQNWDPNHTYRQVVLLVEFSDSTFSMDDPHTYYDHLLNLSSSNVRGGVGCAVDYFRDQSNGQFNLQFDVFGPIKVSQSAQASGSGTNYQENAVKEAIKKSVDSLNVDYTPYDWNEDGEVEQIVLIASSYSGNSSASFSKYLHPHTSFLSSIRLTGNKTAKQYSISAEKWGNDIPCGIGTICHEYFHCLGLPDIYPTGGGNITFTLLDEWDLMDGGNFTCWGWNPPNLTAFEKSQFGWLTIDEISEACSISAMKPVADGGKAYKITKEGNEFYVLENRQQTGWDKYAPGKGLLIYHVDYNESDWKYNSVNTSSKYRFELLHADGMDFDAWYAYLNANKIPLYVDSNNRMNSHIFSSSPYPFVTDTIEVRECNELPLPLTNIQLADDGTILFDVLPTGINSVYVTQDDDDNWYDLQGRRLVTKPTRKGIYIHNKKKVAL